MRIVRAEHLGMCFGVRDAIAMAHEQARSGPLTVLGDLVHNQTVINDLKSRDIRIAQKAADVSTNQLMITAHGASDRAKSTVHALGLNVIEATCPLVHHAHKELASLVKTGFHPVVIGVRGHVEVRGLTEDLDDHDIILCEKDVQQLHPRARFGIVAQTTQPIDRVWHLVRLVQQRFPQSLVRSVDTVCQPTKQRQHAAVELAQRCNAVVVIGGTNSNNTHELVRTCARHCARVHHVQTAADLCGEWFHAEDTVGITAGTSTPDAVIDAIESLLSQFSAGRERFYGRVKNRATPLLTKHSTSPSTIAKT